MKVSKFVLAPGAAVAVLVAVAAPADAAFRLRVEDLSTGVGVVVTDQGGNDANPVVDAITYIGAIGNFNITVSVGTATPGAPMAGYFDAIDLNIIVTTTNAAGGRLQAILEKDGFNSPSDGTHSLESKIGGVLSGPAGSSVTVRSWANNANLQPTLGPNAGPPPGVLPPVPDLPPAGSTLAGPLVFTSGAFSGATDVTFVKSGPYSLFSSDLIVLTGPGSVSFDHTTGTNPAPASLALLAAGLPGLAFLRRKKAAVPA